MTLYAGIDGGQSSTVAAIGDEHRELGRGVGPPADLVGEPRDSVRQAAAIGAALEAARAAAGVSAATPVARLVAGITGFDRGVSPAPELGAFAERISVVHDAAIAHAGALDGRAGIVAIAGTGSVALGNADGHARFVRAGGWGYFFGDEGSALWIARAALSRAMRRSDRGERGDLMERALAFYGTTSLRSIQHAFAHGDISRPALASFAQDVLASADDGDADACAVRDEAARELAGLVETIDARLGPASGRVVSYAGGMWQHDALLTCFRDAVRAALPHATVVAPAHDPAAGALLMARALARTANAAT